MRRLAILLLLSVVLLGQARESWLGTWRLNAAKSAQTNSPYKRVTMKIEPQQDGLAVIYDMVGTRGGTTHVEWNGRFDGKDYAVQGMDYSMTNAYTRVDDHNYTIATKRDGQAVDVIKVSVSSDGRTLTAVTANGTTVYDRI